MWKTSRQPPVPFVTSSISPVAVPVVEATLARVWQSGCRVLAVTIDTNTPGLRERDIRNGTAALIGPGVFNKVPFMSQLLARPRWLFGFSTIDRT